MNVTKFRNNMKFINLILVFVFSSNFGFCQLKVGTGQPQNIVGDFVFQAVRFTYFEGSEKNFNELDSAIDNRTGNDEMLLFLSELRSLGLQRVPYIYLRQDNQSNKYSILFLSWDVYKELEYRQNTWDCWSLQENGKKVEVTAEVEPIALKSIPVSAYRILKPPKFEIKDGKAICN